MHLSVVINCSFTKSALQHPSCEVFKELDNRGQLVLEECTADNLTAINISVKPMFHRNIHKSHVDLT